MDFIPHSSLRECSSTLRNNGEDKSSDEGVDGIETNKLLDNHQTFSVLLMPRSLLIFKDKAYSGGPHLQLLILI